MKTHAKAVLLVMLLFLVCGEVFAEDGEGLVIPLYAGSTIRDDNLVGYEEFPFIVDESTILVETGYLQRLFCLAPENRSPLEIAKNYEQAIKDNGGTILFTTRKPQEIEVEERPFEDVFREHRKDPGLSTNVASQSTFPENITEYLVGKLSSPGRNFYIIVAVGTGIWAAGEDGKTFYELVFLEVEAMEMGMITATGIADVLGTQGKIAIYELFFDIGKAEIKQESTPALQVIAEYLNANKEQKVLIVGHTDNTGDFEFNLDLSKKRADAVIAKLILDYGVNAEQMKPFGAGPAAPVSSNATEKGRAKNRRVEIVEQ